MFIIDHGLRLSVNGGVYFDSDRLDTTREAVIVIGLGGTGADVLLGIKNQIMNRMKRPMDNRGNFLAEYPDNIVFLEIDADRHTQRKSVGQAAFSDYGRDVEYIDADIAKLIAAVKNNHGNDPAWNWFDSNITEVGGGNGANGCRQVGRLLLFHSLNRVCNKISSLMVNAAAAAGSSSIKIIICTGIGGGTGAGTFMDVAYLARKIAGDRALHPTVLGYVVMPDANLKNGAPATNLNSNAYACMQEIEYYMNMEIHDQPFEQDYPGLGKVLIRTPPFDFCHLVSASDCNGVPKSYKDVVSTIANNVFTYLAGESGAGASSTMDSLYANIKHHVATMQKAYAASYGYLSIGSVQKELPYTEITTLLASKVFLELEPVFQNKPDEKSFGYDLSQVGLTPDNLFSLASSVLPPYALSGGKIKGKRIGFDHIWPNNTVYPVAHAWLADAQPEVASKTGNMAQILVGNLKAYLDRLCRAKKRGPCYAARMLCSESGNSLYNTAKALEAHYRELKVQCDHRSAVQKSLMDQHWARGNGLGPFSLEKGNVTKDYMEALEEWRHQNICAHIYDGLEEVCSKFAIRLRSYYDDMFSPLRNILVQLPGIFKENIVYIQNKENEMKKAGDDRWLIMPTDFAIRFGGKFEDAQRQACDSFWNSLTDNMKKWVGIGLEDFDTPGAIRERCDVVHTLSSFIEPYFKASISVTIEDVLQPPAGMTIQDYGKTMVNQMDSQAVPLFSQRTVAGFAPMRIYYVSVPDNCVNLVNGISQSNCISTVPGSQLKQSAEHSILSITQVIYGLPLYAFSFMESMEKSYCESQPLGVHLRTEWLKNMGSVMPRDTYTTTTPQPALFAKREAEQRSQFERAMGSDIIVIDEGAGSIMGTLRLADDKWDLATLKLNGNLAKRMAQLQDVRQNLWNGNCDRQLTLRVGNNTSRAGVSKEQLLCESNIRFPHIVSLVEGQLKLDDTLRQLELVIQMSKLYEQMLELNLIAVNPLKSVIRKTQQDPIPEVLATYELTECYPEYKAFQALLERYNTDKTMEARINKLYMEFNDRMVDADKSKQEAFETWLKDVQSRYQKKAKEASAAKDAATSDEKCKEMANCMEFYQNIDELFALRLQTLNSLMHGDAADTAAGDTVPSDAFNGGFGGF